MANDKNSFDDLGAKKEGGLAAHPLAGLEKKGGKGPAALLGLLVIVACLGGVYALMGGDETAPATPVAMEPIQQMQQEAAADPAVTDPAANPADQPPLDMMAAQLPSADTTPAPPVQAAADAGIIPPAQAEAIVAEPVKIESSTAATTTLAATAQGKAVAAVAEPAADTAPPEAELKDAAPATAAATGGRQPSAEEQQLIDSMNTREEMHREAAAANPSSPTDKAATTSSKPAEIPVKKALIRPTPQKYLVVKKDHNADDMDSRLTAARLALTQGRDQSALDMFNELQGQYPRDARVAMGRAVSLQRLGMDAEALTAYEQVLTRNPRSVEALTNMLGLIKAQDPQLALSKLRQLRETYPASPDITAQLGIAYGGTGDYASALKYLEISQSLNPGNTSILFNKAVVYDHMGQAAQAAELYREVVRRASEGKLEETLPIEAIKARLAVLH